MYVIMDVSTIDALQSFMQQPENHKVIEEADHIQEMTEMVMCSD